MRKTLANFVVYENKKKIKEIFKISERMTHIQSTFTLDACKQMHFVQYKPAVSKQIQKHMTCACKLTSIRQIQHAELVNLCDCRLPSQAIREDENANQEQNRTEQITRNGMRTN